MTVVSRRTEESLDDVFAVLSDGSRDSQWVVEAVEPPSVVSLMLRGKRARTTSVRVVLRPYDGGTEIRLESRQSDGPASRFDNPLLRAVSRRRTRESLRRLSNMVASGVRQTA